MKTRAFGKVNLALDVVGVLDNGYHDLRMIMVPITLCDVLEMEINERMVYECDKPFIYFDENNTIVQAIDLMRSTFNISDNFLVRLKKNIPIKAGLAGGSSDGAAVIRLLKRMYNLRLSKGQISELCLSLGADVLFTYYNRPALVEGIGDRLSFFDIDRDYYVLLVKPKGGVSTRECYGALDMNDCVHPDVDLIMDNLMRGLDFYSLMANSLQGPAIKLCGQIGEARDVLLGAGARVAMVSGSGSTVFCIDDDYERIRAVANNLPRGPYFINLCKVLRFE